MQSVQRLGADVNPSTREPDRVRNTRNSSIVPARLLLVFSTVLVSGDLGLAGLAAQDAPSVSTGSRVRIIAPTLDLQRAVGVVQRVDSDTILVALEQGPTMAIAWSDITEADVSAGLKNRRTKGILIGAASGAVVGFVAGLAEGDDAPDQGFFDGPTFSAAEKGAIVGLAMAAVGAGVGALIGKSMTTDDWRPIEHRDLGMRFQVAPASRGVELRLSLVPG